jgi:periplasmic protein TonB
VPTSPAPDTPTLKGSAYGQPAGSAYGQPAGSAYGQPVGSACTQPAGSAYTQPVGSAYTQPAVAAGEPAKPALTAPPLKPAAVAPPPPALTLEPIQKPTLQVPPRPTPPTLLPATTVSPSNRTDGVHLEAPRTEPVKTKKPAAIANDWRPKSVPKPPKPMNQLLLPMAALVLVAVGLGGYWVRMHGGLSAVLEGETADAGNKPGRAPQPAARPAEPAKPVALERTVKPEPQPEPKPRAAQPKPAARQAAATTPKPRPATTHAPEPIQAAAVAVPAVATVPPPAPVSAASTAASAASAPQGPFFEPTDVHEAPKVASKVAPEVPAELRAQARNEIVIVRMLISQIGHPSRVSLLRKSKTGSKVDNAVIAAVSQWTFSPAKRRGEAVSSWFNIGVPVMAN